MSNFTTAHQFAQQYNLVAVDELGHSHHLSKSFMDEIFCLFFPPYFIHSLVSRKNICKLEIVSVKDIFSYPLQPPLAKFLAPTFWTYTNKPGFPFGYSGSFGSISSQP